MLKVISALLNFLPTSGVFCCLLIAFANCLDPDQDQQLGHADSFPERFFVKVN